MKRAQLEAEIFLLLPHQKVKNFFTMRSSARQTFVFPRLIGGGGRVGGLDRSRASNFSDFHPWIILRSSVVDSSS